MPRDGGVYATKHRDRTNRSGIRRGWRAVALFGVGGDGDERKCHGFAHALIYHPEAL